MKTYVLVGLLIWKTDSFQNHRNLVGTIVEDFSAKTCLFTRTEKNNI